MNASLRNYMKCFQKQLSTILFSNIHIYIVSLHSTINSQELLFRTFFS